MFWERFYALCIQKKKSPLQVVKEIGIATGSITKWKYGSTPSGSSLDKISEYFNVSVDYLLGKTNAVTNNNFITSPDILTEQEKYLIECFRETTEEGRFEMIAAIMEIKKRIEKNAGSEDSSRIG